MRKYDVMQKYQDQDDIECGVTNHLTFKVVQPNMILWLYPLGEYKIKGKKLELYNNEDKSYVKGLNKTYYVQYYFKR